jgi:hypothetical protein
VNEAGANLFDLENELRPRADIQVPEGHRAIQMLNAQRTSGGIAAPGQVITLPDDEARRLLTESFAREVRVGPVT